MGTKSTTINLSQLFDPLPKPTEQQDPSLEKFYWDKDDLVHIGQGRTKMSKALSRLPSALREPFKQHVLFFSKLGNYSPASNSTTFSALKVALEATEFCTFDIEWITQALKKPSVRRQKIQLTQFFLRWHERGRNIITPEALRLLSGSAAFPLGPSNVLSDNPEKSWLSNDEYEHLLSTVWHNYDSGFSSTQITLIRLLSMQFARRPIQISLLKIGDIREVNDADFPSLTGRIIDFPGVKDITAKTNYRDSKFEPHPLADHLWDLCQIQIHDARTLYERTFGFKLSDDQLKVLPLFCSKNRIEEAVTLLEERCKLKFTRNLNSQLFHLQSQKITEIVVWARNTPSCNYSEESHRRSFLPKPPISNRTGRTMVVTAIRMRHTRARQLARQEMPKHLLSHWLGHTSAKSLDAYYNDPAEQARALDTMMAPLLAPLAMAFTGKLLDSADQATRSSDPNSMLETASANELKSVGYCGKHSFCATTSVPIPCYRCKLFEPLVDAPHQEVLEALMKRQAAEQEALKIGGQRNLLIPIDLSSDIRAVENCIARCNARKTEREKNK